MAIHTTTGKDGRKYYFNNGKRISATKAKLLKARRKKKSKKKDKCDEVVCTSDKVCNPASGRCVKKTGKIGKSLLKAPSPRKKSKKKDKCDEVVCTSDKVCNPASGRCVKKTGKIGKSLLKAPSPRKKSKKKDKCDEVVCTSDKVCNPASGRCVKKTGKIGKNLLSSKKPERKPSQKSRKKPSKTERKPHEKFKPCKPHQVRDPITHRCKNKSVYKRDREKSGRFKPCPPHQERDPVTHRCKNKSGYKRDRPKKTKPRPKYEEKPRWEDTKKDKRNCVESSKLSLRKHQKKVVRYMREHPSLLVVHGTGTGKTLTAVTISKCYLDDNPTHRVVFVGPASLKSNFIKELRRYGLQKTYINTHYEFYSFDKFLLTTKRMLLNKVTNKTDRSKIGWPVKPISLKNSLLIIDEAHNMRNPLGAKSRALTKASFTADKRLLLTATPYVNNMRDFIPLINMLYGGYVIGTYREHQKDEVLDYLTKEASPENLNTFENLLQDKVDVVDKREEDFFPERKDHMVFVYMTQDYLKRYTRLMQQQQVAGLFFKNPHLFYNGFRRAVNKAGPEYFSSKIAKAVPILKKGKSLIYSNWREFGVVPISESLKKADISFKTFTGSTKISERQQIVDDFNQGKFQVLVVTKAGGEGLDLKEVKSVVVLDPPWNDAGLQQVIGRAIRYKSHERLPTKDQVVNVYLMALIAPGAKKEGLSNPDGTPNKDLSKTQVIDSGDLLLYDIIKYKKKLEEVLLEALKRMSITR